jgi:sarcosine oxidase
MRALVVGAGVFGASTAHELRLRGWDVTLAEQYVPGHVRSASGGDTRLIRFAHGDDEWYSRLAWRARELWLGLERATGTPLFDPRGIAWFQSGGDFEDLSEATLRGLDIPVERLDPAEAGRLFPSLGGDDLVSVLFEPEAGVLHARRATQALVEKTVAEGTTLVSDRLAPSELETYDYDRVVWACGAWLPRLFPGLVRIKSSRRDVFFFGGGASWAHAPGWCDYHSAFYGHGDVGGLGIKVAPDGPGQEIDPDTFDRVPGEENLAVARAYMARRFPSLAEAPLLAARVCQYALTADSHFVIAPHPEQDGWWLLGGGSGHGFKHGPALAEHVADLLEGKAEPDPRHGLGERRPGAGLRTATIEL